MRNDNLQGNTLSTGDFQKSVEAMFRPRFGDGAVDIAAAYIGSALEKGLDSTGTQAIAGITTGGDATTMEALHDEVVSTELNMKDHATIWNDLQKVPVLEEFIQKTDMSSYGGFRRGGFINPRQATGGVKSRAPKLKRVGIPNRWVGGRYQTFTSLNSQRTLGLNTDPAVGNAAELNSEARLQQMILNANELVWHGDYDVNSLEPYGILQQIRTATTKIKPTRVNMKGMPFVRDTLPGIRRQITLAGGKWTHFYGAPTLYEDLEISMIDQIRRTDGETQMLGMVTDTALIRGLGGNPQTAKLREDRYLESLGEAPTLSDDDAPIRPSLVTAAVVAATTANVWGGYLASGTHFYTVAAVGINGRSAARAVAAGQIVGATQKVELTITNADSETAFFEVYRGTTATNAAYLGRVGAEDIAAGDTIVFTDEGEFLPGCTSAAALTIMPSKRCNSIHIAQLLPTTKVDMAPELMAREAGWICGFTPRVMNEPHCIVFDNIGRWTG